MSQGEASPSFNSQGERLGVEAQVVTITVKEYMDLQAHNQAMAGQQPRGPPPPSGLGNPGPLGLGAFAMTTMVLSVFNAGVLIDARLEPVVLPLALFYGGIAQFIAGLYEFRNQNTFGATAFCSYGAFWASFALYVWVGIPVIPADKVHEATGLFLLAWGIFTFYMMIASVRVSWAVASVFITLDVTFIFLSAGAFANDRTTTKIGGFIGLVTAACAWYCSAAVVINSTWGREIFPIGVYVPKDKRH